MWASPFIGGVHSQCPHVEGQERSLGSPFIRTQIPFDENSTLRASQRPHPGIPSSWEREFHTEIWQWWGGCTRHKHSDGSRQVADTMPSTGLGGSPPGQYAKNLVTQEPQARSQEAWVCPVTGSLLPPTPKSPDLSGHTSSSLPQKRL